MKNNPESREASEALLNKKPQIISSISKICETDKLARASGKLLSNYLSSRSLLNVQLSRKLEKPLI